MLKRRNVLLGIAALPLAPGRASAMTLRRVRPSDSGWPTEAQWAELGRAVGGRLIKVRSPLDACRGAPDGEACRALFRELKNPYFLGDQVALGETTGWLDAWSYQPSAYAVAAESPADVIAAVDFARTNNLRLVVKGGGHSYLGTSNAPDSLLIWTRRMRAITLHDDFIARGCEHDTPQPAVSVGAGAIWMYTYDAVTTKGGRYVQGGGCGTVGVAGLMQVGGFGSFSKSFGTAAANLLEAEIITADGALRIANACRNADLFWALKGGGGGSFGVVTRLTLRTHDLPSHFGAVSLTIRATSEAAFRRLLGGFVDFYADALANPHWGEIVNIRRDRLDVRMAFQGLDQSQAEAVWRPFLNQIAASPEGFALQGPPTIVAIAARHAWDPAWLKANFPAVIRSDDRPGASADNIFWSANLAEAGHFIRGYQSRWLPSSLLQNAQRERLVDALFAASRHRPIELHFQKGLAGGSATALAGSRDTATNPDMLDAFVLAIVASEEGPAFPGLPGHEPDIAAGRRDAAAIARAVRELRKIAPDGGSYLPESDYFEPDWQRAYWGTELSPASRGQTGIRS